MSSCKNNQERVSIQHPFRTGHAEDIRPEHPNPPRPILPYPIPSHPIASASPSQPAAMKIRQPAHHATPSSHFSTIRYEPPRPMARAPLESGRGGLPAPVLSTCPRSRARRKRGKPTKRCPPAGRRPRTRGNEFPAHFGGAAPGSSSTTHPPTRQNPLMTAAQCTHVQLLGLAAPRRCDLCQSVPLVGFSEMRPFLLSVR